LFRFAPQFSQLILAALFAPRYPAIKNTTRKAGTKKPGASHVKNHRNKKPLPANFPLFP
jgi:hypothetical protein